MKKLLAVLLTVLTAASALVGCGNTGTSASHDIKVVATIFPIYDWVREVAREDVDIEIDLLLDNGVDLHSYQPSAKDIMDISDCDVFVYVGGESDKWVDDVIAQANNDHMIVLDLLDILGSSVKEEELIDGMQGEEEDEDEDEPEYDEHVWLSLKNACNIVPSIEKALSTVDSQHADAFKANADDYINRLTELDGQYQSTVNAASVKTLLFGDRFPFLYMADDYRLDYYAAFTGCSAETEASFETIMFLADKVNELDLHAIMQIESSDGSIAETVRDNTDTKDQAILTLNSMQSTTAADIEGGITYLDIMQSNLGVLTQALK